MFLKRLQEVPAGVSANGRVLIKFLFLSFIDKADGAAIAVLGENHGTGMRIASAHIEDKFNIFGGMSVIVAVQVSGFIT